MFPWEMTTSETLQRSLRPAAVGFVIFLSCFEHRESCKGPFRGPANAGSVNYTNKFAWRSSWILSAHRAWLCDFKSKDAEFCKSFLIKIARRGWGLKPRAPFELWALSQQIVGYFWLCFDPKTHWRTSLLLSSAVAQSLQTRAAKNRKSETSSAAEPAAADVTLGW